MAHKRKLQNDELARLTTEEFKKVDKQPIIVILDNIRSGNNVGSIFRTSDALLVEKIMLCEITAVPPNKEIHKTALGAEHSVSWEYFENTEDAINKLKNEQKNNINRYQTKSCEIKKNCRKGLQTNNKNKLNSKKLLKKNNQNQANNTDLRPIYN